jgi:hypothetical protein
MESVLMKQDTARYHLLSLLQRIKKNYEDNISQDILSIIDMIDNGLDDADNGKCDYDEVFISVIYVLDELNNEDYLNF